MEVTRWFSLTALFVVGESVFACNKTVTKVVIPDSVTKIDDCAFWACKRLESVTIGKIPALKKI